MRIIRSTSHVATSWEVRADLHAFSVDTEEIRSIVLVSSCGGNGCECLRCGHHSNLDMVDLGALSGKAVDAKKKNMNDAGVESFG